MRIDPKFQNTLTYWAVSDEIGEVIARYMIDGLQPGGFFRSVLANDMIGAMPRSHPSNSVIALGNLCRWIFETAPAESWGSYEKVDAWCRLTIEQREKILLDHNLIQNVFEMLADNY